MSNRTEKLNAEFKRYISELLVRKVKDPRITEMFTILDVNCDKELSSAKVYVSIFSTNSEKAAQTFLAICENEHVIRKEISRSMHIRKVPEFKFVLDESLAYSQKIAQVLNEIRKEQNND